MIDDFRGLFEVNTFGPFYLSRALFRSWAGLPIGISDGIDSHQSLPQATNLNKQILFVSSISGHVAMTPQKQCAYNSSKAALSMLAKVSCAVVSKRVR